ncbi:GNAT family N-acetyltransferase [Neobacillus niacini]|uniref:GNAT family N-acetyltransferase n=1 Tax=Neobacillus niacini TaxID=86668 RepID=UPI0021CB6EF7|nr:GNAT family N-acetyltransferase [Neobacillus niacini]MCM3764550.1 GNAT family N-acetyltransferase [Neobacillus niacini]
MGEPSTSTETVVLDFFNEKYRSYLEDYYLSEDQVKFTAHPLDALLACKKDPTRFPVVIFYNDLPAGFFVLHGWEGVKEYWDNRAAILLRGYSVNTAFQGRGIAQKSMALLPEFVKQHFPDRNEIILSVNHGNALAQHVYKKSGFVDKGVRTMGSKGELHIYHMLL